VVSVAAVVLALAPVAAVAAKRAVRAATTPLRAWR